MFNWIVCWKVSVVVVLWSLSWNPAGFAECKIPENNDNSFYLLSYPWISKCEFVSCVKLKNTTVQNVDTK